MSSYAVCAGMHTHRPGLRTAAASPPGVPLLERSYEARFGGQEAYEAYRASTNMLLPWWPRCS